mmetsp:Transcript_8878/g.18962  ORF Transcript_8878/g.18962 Transcript_8878/m.18962 type:complete len:208 (-) Transcript_8878:929-1552(-)
MRAAAVSLVRRSRSGPLWAKARADMSRCRPTTLSARVAVATKGSSCISHHGLAASAWALASSLPRSQRSSASDSWRRTSTHQPCQRSHTTATADSGIGRRDGLSAKRCGVAITSSGAARTQTRCTIARPTRIGPHGLWARRCGVAAREVSVVVATTSACTRATRPRARIAWSGPSSTSSRGRGGLASRRTSWSRRSALSAISAPWRA